MLIKLVTFAHSPAAQRTVKTTQLAQRFGDQRERLMVIEVLASFFLPLHDVIFLGLNLAHVEFLRHERAFV